MRILYVSHSFPVRGEPLSNVGGMQRVSVDLHRGLANHPEVGLTAICLETSWHLTGVRTGPFLLSLLARVPAAAHREQVNVVLFSSMVTASIAPFIRRRMDAVGVSLAAIPVGRDLTLPNPFYQRMVGRVLRSLDLVFPISRATADEAYRRGATTHQVQVVPCGVDFTRVPAPGGKDARRSLLRKRLRDSGFDLPDNAFLLLSVGRHQERKGFHWFAGEVMPLLDTRVVYLVAGSGPMTTAIEEGAARRGVRDRVHLLGQVSEELLMTLYGGADVFIMPNVPVAGDIEGFGVVMLEAGAAGLPVVAADLEGIRDVITPGENGWLAPPRDAEAFRRLIGEFQNSPDADRVGERAARHVRSTFSWSNVVDQYLAAFRARGVAAS